MSTWTDVAQAVGSLGAMGAAAYAAWLARDAARSWRSTLRQERADACLMAALDLQGRAGQLREFLETESKGAFWTSYDAAHRARTAYGAALIVCDRYFDGLNLGAPNALHTALLYVEAVAADVFPRDKPQDEYKGRARVREAEIIEQTRDLDALVAKTIAHLRAILGRA